MIILGLNYLSHDAAAAIVSNGRVVAACEEERFNRQKHSSSFPLQAIRYCLKSAGVGLDEVDKIALFVNPHLHYKLGFYNLLEGFPKSVLYLPHAAKLLMKRYSMKSRLVECVGKSMEYLVHYVDHHVAHATSAFYPSPFDSAAILTIDGRGEFETLCIYAANGNSIKKLHSIKFPHSVGYLYSMVTRYLGFVPQSDEYKVMGLSSYGTPALCEKFSNLARFDDGGNLKLNLGYFDHHYRYGKSRNAFSDKFVCDFGKPRAIDEPISQRHADIAFALQRLTEEILMSFVRFTKRLTHEDALCIAGGVALNCVANSKIVNSGEFKHIFVQPAANDAGTSVGAALYVYYLLSHNGQRYSFKDVYLGPSFTEQDLARELCNYQGRIITTRVDCPTSTGAQLIHDGYLIGWFQGRMEFGPRALGNRSILAAPTDKSVRDLINKKVKFREEFRPFAPAVLSEYKHEYFECDSKGHLLYPFMLSTVKVRPEAVAKIPAVVHVDGTARIQVVEKVNNPLFWKLIKEYHSLSGIPVVLNTSFNIGGEPIVCSIKDAIDSFLHSGLNCIFIGNFLLEKSDGRTYSG